MSLNCDTYLNQCHKISIHKNFTPCNLINNKAAKFFTKLLDVFKVAGYNSIVIEKNLSIKKY